MDDFADWSRDHKVHGRRPIVHWSKNRTYQWREKIPILGPVDKVP